MNTFSIAKWPAMGSLCLLAGCVVPLKTPPIHSVNTEKPAINFARLAEFAQAAGNAYQTDEVIESAYGKPHVIIRNLPRSDGKYFIYLNHADRTQTIAIRGSANKTNAWVDLESVKIPDTKLGISVHSGFKRAANELYADLAPFLQKDYKTRLTGHSLGGAMACLLMMHLMRDGIPVDQVLTFGQPKVTNEAGGKKYENTIYFRIINNNDLVAQVPPSNLVFDLTGPFQHFGPEITLLPDGTWTTSPVHLPKDYLTGDKWKDLNLENGIDHQMENYINRIKAIKPH